jgi:menaquinone-dependent protoporphyrinogen oxidase
MNESREDGSPRVLIAFATMYGQTGKIARFLEERLEARGIRVLVKPCREVAGSGALESFDAVVVGGSVIMEGLHRDARRFVAQRVDELNDTTSAFFQVSGAAGSTLETEREAARSIMDRFLAKSGWSPTERASLAGGIPYTKYPFWLKWVMRWISAKNGGSTDTSRDHEYTDWTQVATFADAVAERVLEGASTTPTA